MAEQRDNLNLSGQTDVRLSFDGDTFHGTTNCNGTGFRGNGFKNAVFEGPATFNSAKFHSGADFTGAVFKDHADFENAEFYGGAVDFSDAVFLAGASFKNVKFGSPYQRIFGEWEIRFSSEKESNGEEFYTLKIRKVGNAAEKWKKLDRISVLPGRDFGFNLEGWAERHEYRHLVVTAFNKFRENPQSVSFAGCRFGEIKIDGFSKEEINEVIGKAHIRIKKGLGVKRDEEEQSLKLFEDKYKETKFNGLPSEQEKTVIMAILAKYLGSANLRELHQYEKNQEVSFAGTSFYLPRDVDFNETLFLICGDAKFNYATFNNDEDVKFNYVTFGNGGDVEFRSTCFGNSWHVEFCSATFSNCGSVGFGSAIFGNGGHVNFASARFVNRMCIGFDSASFGNNLHVVFFSTTFNNGGDIKFDSATFSNGGNVVFQSTHFGNSGYVDFDYVTFSNKGEVGLSKIVWINSRGLNFSIKEFRETLSVKFDECLFLCVGDISFKDARFPEKGSLMFQRCYFGRTPSVNFTGAFFRHTSFEGGEISWLKEKDKTPEQILRERMGKKYDDLSPKTKKELNTRTTPVFEEGTRVLWKDLTTESAKNLTLRRVNLSHSIFDGMTLSHIQLNAPQWFEKDGRRMLFEEKNIKRDIRNLENIEDQYTQLKNNLEKQGNYLNAGYFHYGEQEIRREILWKKRSLFNWFLSWCYKWLSGYGEKPWWALVTTLFSILLFSFILILLDGTSLTFLPEVLVEVITPFSWKGSESLKATLTNTHGIDLLRIYLLIVFQILFLGIQLPLLVLAVRRRFKR